MGSPFHCGQRRFDPLQHPRQHQDARGLHDGQDQTLHDAGGKQRLERRSVQQRDPVGVDEQAQNELVDEHSGNNALRRLFFVEEQAEHEPGERGCRREAGEIGSDGEKRSAEEIRETAADGGFDRPQQNSCCGDGDESKPDLHIPGADGDETAEDDLHGDEHAQDSQSLYAETLLHKIKLLSRRRERSLSTSFSAADAGQHRGKPSFRGDIPSAGHLTRCSYSDQKVFTISIRILSYSL